MPKKAKGRGKEKGKKGKGDRKVTPPPTLDVEDVLTEGSKQFYINQITDLEKRLNRYQAKCDTLQLDNMDLQKKLYQQLEDQEQMISFLQHKAQDQTERFVDLEDQLLHAQQVKDEQQKKLEGQVAQLKEESQRALDQVIVENKMLQGQLDTLETFRHDKNKVEKEMEEKQEEIERLKSKHEETLYQLEKKAVLDKGRMMKEMVVKVNNVAAEFRKVSDIQMADTTKRAIRENVSVNQQLTKMSEKSLELIEENKSLKRSERELKLTLQVLESTNTFVTRKNFSRDRILSMLKSKAVEQEVWSSELETRIEHCAGVEQEAGQAVMEAENMIKKVESMQADRISLDDELSRVKAELNETTTELHRLQQILFQSSENIQTFMQLNSISPHGMKTESFDQLLSTLLLLLDEYKPQLGKSAYQPGSIGLVPPPPPPPPETSSPLAKQKLSD